jgi:hypothetical protein
MTGLRMIFDQKLADLDGMQVVPTDVGYTVGMFDGKLFGSVLDSVKDEILKGKGIFDSQVWTLMVLSGEEWDPAFWSNELRCEYRKIVAEFYDVVGKVVKKAEEVVAVDDFEPEIPLISRLLLDPVEWLVSLNESIIKCVMMLFVSRLACKGWTDQDKESFKKVKNLIETEDQRTIDKNMLNRLAKGVSWKICITEQKDNQRRILNNVVREPEKSKIVPTDLGNDMRLEEKKRKIVIDKGKIREECLKFLMNNCDENLVNEERKERLVIGAEGNLTCEGVKLCKPWEISDVDEGLNGTGVIFKSFREAVCRTYLNERNEETGMINVIRGQGRIKEIGDLKGLKEIIFDRGKFKEKYLDPQPRNCLKGKLIVRTWGMKNI